MAPDFSLKDLSGGTHRLSDYRPEKIVLVNFWATWCVPCIKELPHLQALHDRYQERSSSQNLGTCWNSTTSLW